MSDEYIRKQDAVNVVANTAKIVASFNYQYAIDALSALTPADVDPVVHGHWVYIDDDDMLYDTYYCSECHNRITVDSHRRDDIGFTIGDMKRCNRCGAKMDAHGEE